MKQKWSKSRGKYKFYVYSKNTLSNCIEFDSATQVSIYFNMRKRFATDIVKKLKFLNQPALIYDDFIISLRKLSEKDIISIIPNIYIKTVIQKRVKSPTQKTIYGYNVNRKDYEKYLKIFINN